MKKLYNYEVKDVLLKFKTSLDGLASEDASRRLKKDGFNELPKAKKDSVFKIFWKQLIDPIVILLIVAVIASFIVGETIDAIAITFIIMVDLLLGTFQEFKASNTVDALAKLVKEKSIVLRDNKEILIDSKELVVGDIVLLESGNKVGADIRILEAHNFTVNEAILTGESFNVEKSNVVLEKNNLALSEQSNMVFAGTNVVTGRAKGVVVGVGLATEIGKIAETIHNTKEEKSPLTIRVEKFSRQISILILFIAVIVASILISKNVAYSEVFLAVIALSVSAMPEGLPLALTMALTIASNRMAKRKVVAKKLHSVESLGSCTVIASDKTGTLTVNEQTAKKILLPNDFEYNITGEGYTTEGEVVGEKLIYAKELAFYGVINNEAKFSKKEKIGDSIDIAFLVLGEKLKVDKKNVKILDYIPYESANKYSAVFYEKEGEVFCSIKGSLEKVCNFCKTMNFYKDLNIQKLDRQNEKMASEGYRVIALATGKVRRKDKYQEEDIKNLKFMGMVGFIDPIRKEAISSIKQCSEAGIKVLMITGDHPLTSFSIAKELGLTKDKKDIAMSSDVDAFYKKGQKAFDEFVASKKIFARVDPLQKLQIIESLKRQGEFVAVTGDGVNDASALKTANIGIAMGSGTDIAKETAKMVVLDDNFRSIVNGVKEGRIAYANIRKITYFLLSCGLAEVLFFCLALLFDMPMPLIAIQLLWLNVVTDGLQDFALSFEKGEKNIMKNPPQDPKESLFNNDLMTEIAFSGTIIGLLVFAVWFYLIKYIRMDVGVARGYIMALMVFLQNVHVFNCRSEKNSAFSVSIKSNLMIFATIIGSILLQIIVMESRILSKFLQTTIIPFNHLLWLLLLSFSILGLMEIFKILRKRNM